jgi:flagellar L-ring protein precursor FlgH
LTYIAYIEGDNMTFRTSCALALGLGVALMLSSMRPQSAQAGEREKQPRRSAESKKPKSSSTEPEERPVVEPAPPSPAPSRPATGSLFSDSSPMGNLLSDFKAQRIGDLVFIDVVEESTSSVESTAKRSRDSGTLAGLVGLIGAMPLSGASTAATVASGLGVRKFEGKGESTRASSMTARIAARVIEVLPNGDLRVEAEKKVNLNREHEKMTLSGIVRRRDLTVRNTVQSTLVGDLRVALNGKGVASADSAPGWLFRLFEKIAPF